MVSIQQRVEGGLLGLLIGDAVGVPYEFHQPAALPSIDLVDLVPPANFARSHPHVPPGTWSDDGAHALALLASLLDRDRLDPDDVGRRLLDWYDSGYLAVDGIVFDVGIQTSHALANLRAGIAAHQAGPADQQANGNGALMRVLPLALWHRGADADLIHDAQRQSLVTHGHLRPQVCCALYCLWARRTLEHVDDPWQNAVQTLRAAYQSDPTAAQELEWAVRPDDDAPGQGSGYVVDCLRSARWAVQQGGYADVVKAAISLGHDTDTTACVAGGIAGIRDGVEAIPQHWRTQLRGQQLYQPLIQRLLERYV